MKSVFTPRRILLSSLAIACAAVLAACGGGSGNLALGGVINGLSKDGLVLVNNGKDDLAITPAAGAQLQFVFPTLIKSDDTYNVTVKASPPSAVCTVVNGKGTAGAFNVGSVVVNCITNLYELGGTVSGLSSNGLVLINGSDRVTVPAGATSFVFTRATGDGFYPYGKVPDGYPYGVSVLTQPAGKTCAVTNGTGTMGSASITNVTVTCV